MRYEHGLGLACDLFVRTAYSQVYGEMKTGHTMDKISVTVALGNLKDDETYKRLIEKTDFDVGMYRPNETDDQTPHERDEVYVVATGTGEFVCAGERQAFVAGDLFYVPAGIEHRFENYSGDFSTWVVFIGARK
jgi:mannose-6-phosphate isomerase-like protein (cupin superfamily)